MDGVLADAQMKAVLDDKVGLRLLERVRLAKKFIVPRNERKECQVLHTVSLPFSRSSRVIFFLLVRKSEI